MARPAVVVTPPAASPHVVSAVGVALMLLILVALLVWPLLDLLMRGLTSMSPSLRNDLFTLAVGAASTLGALGMASIVAAAVRTGGRGGHVLRGILRIGLLVPPFVVPVAMVAVAGNAGALSRALGDRVPGGALGIVLGQAFAFLPAAFALVLWALAAVPADAEQAAELLGASRWTVFRRITLGLAQPRLYAAGTIVAGLCFADVTTPLLLGTGDPVMLAVRVVSPADSTLTTAGGAFDLWLLMVCLRSARMWREAAMPFGLETESPAGSKASAGARPVLATLAWLIAAAVVGLWVTVPLASLHAVTVGSMVDLEHWRSVLGAARPLRASLLLGLGAAFVSTALTLLTAAVASRGHDVVARVTTWLTRVPLTVPGVVASLGYVTAFGAPRGDVALLVLLVAAWSLPLTVPVAAAVLAGADRAREHAALSLGAGRVTTLRRVVLPSLGPAAAWIFLHGFAAGLTAVGAALVFVERGHPALGVTHMLASASTGAVGAACAVATVLLALAGGAALLGRAVAGRDSIPTLLA